MSTAEVNVRFTPAQLVLGRMVRSDEWLGSWVVFHKTRELDAPESLRGKLIKRFEGNIQDTMGALGFEVSDIDPDTVEVILSKVEELFYRSCWVSRLLLWLIGEQRIASWMFGMDIPTKVLRSKAASHEVTRAFLLGVLWRVISPSSK